MTSLSAAPTASRPPAPVPPVSATFGPRICIGLFGVLLAVLASGLNENIAKVSFADIRGGIGIGSDEGSWLLAVYTAASVSAMAFAPWFSATLSLRRFTLGAIGAFMLLGLLAPLATQWQALLVLRALQGLAGGAMPPMLMTVALRFLPPGIKLYGLAGYALTATFGPAMGTPLAAFWTELAGWRWTFWQVVPLCLPAMAAVAWGLPQDPLKLERFRQFDGIGMALGLASICMLTTGLTLGERLDWFESGLICTLLAGGGALLVLFLAHEWSHPLPFFKLQLLRNRNLTHSLITLGGVLFVLLAVIRIPSAYLAVVQGYRPLQTAPLMLLLAGPQALALPAVAALCNLRRVDCRWVLAIGLGLLAWSCWLASGLTSSWSRENFYLSQGVQILAQPMAVLPLLMLATSGLAPQDGPFASAWFNTVKGFAAVLAGGVIDALGTQRSRFHSNLLVDQLGNSPLLADPTSLALRLHQQVMVLTSADLYRCMAVLAVALIFIIPLAATRIHAPRAAAPSR